MSNSLRAYELVRQLLNVMRPAAQHDYFEARIVIQVSVQGGDNDFVMLMLKIGELLWEKASMMVINQGYGSYNRGLRCYNRGADESIPDQVPERLGPVVIPFFGNEPVKAIE